MRLADVILKGTHAARPAASTLPDGTLYAEEDTHECYQVVAGVWELWLKGVA